MKGLEPNGLMTGIRILPTITLNFSHPMEFSGALFFFQKYP